MSLDILSIISNKKNYDRYVPFIKANLVEEEFRVILKDLKIYYEANETVDWDQFGVWFKFTQHPLFSTEKLEVYDKLFTNIKLHIPAKSATDVIVENFIARDYCLKMGELGMKGADCDIAPEDAVDDIFVLAEKYNKEVDKVSKVEKHFVGGSLSDLFTNMASVTGFNWRLPCLNKSLGVLYSGAFIVIGARPEAGKTTLLVSEVTHMATQLSGDEKVLYINNEGSGAVIWWRMVQSTLGKTAKWCKDNPQQAVAEYTKAMGGDEKRIKIFSKGSASVYDVTELLKAGNYKLIAFDQLWKVHGFQKEAHNAVDRQTKLFNWARELSMEYGPVITVHQVGGDGQDKKWLTMDMLYGSTTGIQGEADAIILMGQVGTAGLEDQRYLCLAKNKMLGADQAHRSSKTELTILSDIARFEEPTPVAISGGSL